MHPMLGTPYSLMPDLYDLQYEDNENVMITETPQFLSEPLQLVRVFDVFLIFKLS